MLSLALSFGLPKSRREVDRRTPRIAPPLPAPRRTTNQGVFGSQYASVPKTGNRISKFSFPMLSLCPEIRFLLSFAHRASHATKTMPRSAFRLCTATGGRFSRQEAAQSCCYTSGTLFAAKDIGGKYTEGLLPSSSLLYLTETASNVHCIWLVELAASKWLSQCPSMLAVQRTCERDRTRLIGLVSRHLSRKSEMFGLLNSSTISHHS